MTKNLKKAVSGAACVAAAVVLTAGGAAARPFESGTFDDVEHYTNDCGDGLVLDVTLEAAGRFIARLDRNGDVLVQEMSTHTWTRTNPATGKSMVTVIKGLYAKDMSVTTNPDGTILVSVISPNRAVDYGPDGKVAFFGAGNERFTALLDADGNFVTLVSDTFDGFSDRPGICEAARMLLT